MHLNEALAAALAHLICTGIISAEVVVNDVPVAVPEDSLVRCFMYVEQVFDEYIANVFCCTVLGHFFLDVLDRFNIHAVRVQLANTVVPHR